MSDSIKNVLAAPAAEKPEPGRGAAQKQQWRLMFEKAYLALSRNGTTDSGARMENAGHAAGNVDCSQRAPSDEMADEFDRIIGNEADQGALANDRDRSDPPGLAFELAGGRFERRIVELLNAVMPMPRERPAAAVVRSQSAPEPVRVAGHREAIPEKSVLLLPAAEGIELIIRDAVAGSDLISRFILKVRDILEGRGIRLARVVVNGAEVWAEKTGAAAPDDEISAAASDLINRIY